MRKRTPRQKDSLLSAIGPLALVVIWAVSHVGNDAASKSKPLADQITTGSLLVAFEGKIMEFSHALYTYFAMNLEKLPQTAMLATWLDQTR